MQTRPFLNDIRIGGCHRQAGPVPLTSRPPGRTIQLSASAGIL